jgi:uroporphyrinogen-III synthase
VTPQPLAGKRILVTRARHQASQLTKGLEDLGAEVIEIPAIEIQPPESFGPFDQALRNLQQYQWLIVTSANTVQALRVRMTAVSIHSSAFSHLHIAAVGAATAQALTELGLLVTVTPGEYVAESLLEILGDNLRGQRVLIARSAIARDVIPKALEETGAIVDAVDAYRTIIPQQSISQVAELFSGRHPIPDAATFTSSSTVTNFFQLLKTAGIPQPPSSMQAISIGPITSKTLRDHQWELTAEANPHDIDGLIAAIVQCLNTGTNPKTM